MGRTSSEKKEVRLWLSTARGVYRSMIPDFFWPKLNGMNLNDMWFEQDGATCTIPQLSVVVAKKVTGATWNRWSTTISLLLYYTCPVVNQNKSIHCGNSDRFTEKSFEIGSRWFTNANAAIWKTSPLKTYKIRIKTNSIGYRASSSSQIIFLLNDF